MGYVFSFATDVCDHNELVDKSRDAFECSKKFDARVFGNARNNSGNDRFCQIVKDRLEVKGILHNFFLIDATLTNKIV